MGKEMSNFPTAEDIELRDMQCIFDVDEHDHWKITIYKSGLTKNKAEKLKQQILSEHEIVERLKSEYEATKNINMEGNPFLINGSEYQEIIENILMIKNE